MTRKTAKKFTTYFNYIGGITLPMDVVRLCHHTGDCTEDVIRCMELPEVAKELTKIDPDSLIEELSEFGAWDAEQLASHTDNLKRILWIAAGNIQEENQVYFAQQ